MEMTPLDSVKKAVEVKIQERLDVIKTVWTFYQEVEKDPKFLREVFQTGNFLLFQRSRDNFLSRIRIAQTVDVGDTRTSWIMGHPMTPVMIGRVYGGESREMANMLVDSGFAVYSRQAEHPVRTMMRRGLQTYNNIRLRLRTW